MVSVDVNNTARTIVYSLIGNVPVAGTPLKLLTQALWPEAEEDVWATLKDDVEALIDEKLDDTIYSQLEATLTGLKNNLDSYLDSIDSSAENPDFISQKYNVAIGNFEENLPQFQLDGREVLLLPLFTQCVNMYLCLLRDGIIYGLNWGWTEAAVDDLYSALKTQSTEFSDYVDTYYQQGLETITKNTKANDHNTEPFKSVNSYTRSMTLNVLDYKYVWKFLNPLTYSTFPNEAIYPDREIYSDPYGTADDSGPVSAGGFGGPNGASANPTGEIEKIQIWGWDLLEAVCVTYPGGEGPYGGKSYYNVSRTDSPIERDHSGEYLISETGNIVSVDVISGHILDGMALTFEDGSTSGKLGARISGATWHNVSYSGHILSSVKIMGESKFYKSPDCMVLGFKYNEDYATKLFSNYSETLTQADDSDISAFLAYRDKKIESIVTFALSSIGETV